jgi:uncharacterized SAM-binding protein YcdF (DUF218 family)
MFLKICGVMGGLVVAVAALAAYTPLVNIWAVHAGTRSQSQRCEAVVVLGSGMFPNGTLNNASYRRTVSAIQLHQQGLARYLVLLGADKQANVSEAAARADLARSLGVSDADIFTESRGMTTRAEAALSRNLLFPRGIRSILLVTDSQHMTRSVNVFQEAGFEVHPVTADEFPLPAMADDDRVELLYHVLSEYVARSYHSLADSHRR